MIGFVTRAAAVSGLVLATAPLGIASFSDAERALMPAYTFSALLSLCVASRRGQRPGVGSLNAWDESLAFNGLACIGHAIQHFIW